jgi:hypothetical protein
MPLRRFSDLRGVSRPSPQKGRTFHNTKENKNMKYKLVMTTLDGEHVEKCSDDLMSLQWTADRMACVGLPEWSKPSRVIFTMVQPERIKITLESGFTFREDMGYILVNE